MFQVRFSTDAPTFKDRDAEIGRILAALGRRFDRGGIGVDVSGPVFDSIGNRVGSWTTRTEDP